MFINKKIVISELIMWNDNTRFDKEVADEKSCIVELFENKPGISKMKALLKDIVETEYIREPCIVFEEDYTYIALDGNRRISLFKINNYPDLVKKYKIDLDQLTKLQKINELECIVYNDLNEAYNHVESRHQGGQNGAGLIKWDPTGKSRMKNTRGEKTSIGYKIFEFFNDSEDECFKYVKNNIKDASTIDRIFVNSHIVKNIFNLKNSTFYDFSDSLHTEKINEILKYFYSNYGNVKNVYYADDIVNYFVGISPIYQNTLFSMCETNEENLGEKIEDENHTINKVRNNSTDSKEPLDVATANDSTINQSQNSALDKNENNVSILPVLNLKINKENNENSIIDFPDDLFNNYNSHITSALINKQNNYSSNFTEVKLFDWTNSGLNFECSVLNYYLKELVSFNLTKDSRGVSKFIYNSSPFFYRAILECAIREFNNKFMSISHKYNLEEKHGDLKNCFNSTSNETSFVNTNKISSILQLTKIIKNQEIKKDIDNFKKELDLFNPQNETKISIFVDDLNNVVHGSIINLTNDKIINYDKYCLNLLKIISQMIN